MTPITTACWNEDHQSLISHEDQGQTVPTSEKRGLIRVFYDCSFSAGRPCATTQIQHCVRLVSFRAQREILVSCEREKSVVKLHALTGVASCVRYNRRATARPCSHPRPYGRGTPAELDPSRSLGMTSTVGWVEVLRADTHRLPWTFWWVSFRSTLQKFAQAAKTFTHSSWQRVPFKMISSFDFLRALSLPVRTRRQAGLRG